jgi:DNA-binding response OmpR family regulator
MPENQEDASMETPLAVKTILVVEDDQDIGHFLEQVITDETPHLALAVTSSDRALEVVQHIKPNLFLLDYRLKTTTGIALYDQLHAQAQLVDVPALILLASIEEHRQDIEERHLTAVSKPFELSELFNTIENMLA